MDPVITPTTSVSPAPAAPSPATTRAERASAIKAAADAPPTEPAVEDSTDGSSPPASTSSTADSAGGEQAPDPRSQAAADRLARIQALREREAQARERRERTQATRVDSEELAQLRQMKAEWEKKDSAFADEESFLAEAERRGISAEKVIGYMRDRLTNPEAIAERKANATKSEIEKKLEALENQLREREERDEQTRREYEYRQKSLAAANRFIDLLQSKKDDAPLTAAMHEKYGPEYVVQFANKFIMPILPNGFDVDEPEHLEFLHDHMEQFLSVTQLGSPPARTESSAPSKAKPVKTNGETPISTLSNRAVSERGTVTEEIPLAKMSLEERKRILKAKYESE
jgi:hypothetical protein